jgi:hypothetical protein
VKRDITDFYFREKLVETFINKIEIYNNKITIWYNVKDGYFMDYSICFSSGLAGAEGLEPSRTVLETAMLPLHHAPRHKRLHIIASHYADVNSRVK